MLNILEPTTQQSVSIEASIEPGWPTGCSPALQRIPLQQLYIDHKNAYFRNISAKPNSKLDCSECLLACLLCGCVYASQYISFHLIRFIEYTAQQFFVQYSERFVFKLEMLYKFYIIIADVIFVRAPLLLLMVIFFYLILYSGIYIYFVFAFTVCWCSVCCFSVLAACSIDITNFIYLYVHFLFCGAQGDAFSIAVREIACREIVLALNWQTV